MNFLVWRYIWAVMYVVVILTVRHFSHTAFEILITTSIAGMIADKVKADVQAVLSAKAVAERKKSCQAQAQC